MMRWTIRTVLTTLCFGVMVVPSRAQDLVTENVAVNHIRAETAASVLRSRFKAYANVVIYADAERKMLTLTGTADEVNGMANYLRAIDANPKGDNPGGPSKFQYHDVPACDLEALEARLRKKFMYDADIRVMVANPRRLFVWGTPRDHALIATEINNFVTKLPPVK